MKETDLTKARKEYTCDICKKKIKIGDKYKRANIFNEGIYHFCDKHSSDEILDYLMGDEVVWDDGYSSNGL